MNLTPVPQRSTITSKLHTPLVKQTKQLSRLKSQNSNNKKRNRTTSHRPIVIPEHSLGTASSQSVWKHKNNHAYPTKHTTTATPKRTPKGTKKNHRTENNIQRLHGNGNTGSNVPEPQLWYLIDSMKPSSLNSIPQEKPMCKSIAST